MAQRDEIVAYADELLEVARWPEFAPQGLQVVGADTVERIACGVSCSLELFQRAVGAGAQLVLVHHGLFWRNEPLVVDARLRGRLEALFRGEASLVAYHLALDAHPQLGNNAQLAGRLDVTTDATFADLGVGGTVRPCSVEDLAARIAEAVDREPLVLRGGDHQVRRVAIVTGGGGYELIRAAHEGYDALVTGEPEEPSLATARELGVHLLAAGHHATERLGVQALAAHLAERFDLAWEFLEVENPV